MTTTFLVTETSLGVDVVDAVVLVTGEFLLMLVVLVAELLTPFLCVEEAPFDVDEVAAPVDVVLPVVAAFVDAPLTGLRAAKKDMQTPLLLRVVGKRSKCEGGRGRAFHLAFVSSSSERRDFR